MRMSSSHPCFFNITAAQLRLSPVRKKSSCHLHVNWSLRYSWTHCYMQLWKQEVSPLSNRSGRGGSYGHAGCSKLKGFWAVLQKGVLMFNCLKGVVLSCTLQIPKSESASSWVKECCVSVWWGFPYSLWEQRELENIDTLFCKQGCGWVRAAKINTSSLRSAYRTVIKAGAGDELHERNNTAKCLRE